MLFRSTAVVCGLWTIAMVVYYQGSSCLQKLRGKRTDTTVHLHDISN